MLLFVGLVVILDQSELMTIEKPAVCYVIYKSLDRFSREGDSYKFVFVQLGGMMPYNSKHMLGQCDLLLGLL